MWNEKHINKGTCRKHYKMALDSGMTHASAWDLVYAALGDITEDLLDAGLSIAEMQTLSMWWIDAEEDIRKEYK